MSRAILVCRCRLMLLFAAFLLAVFPFSPSFASTLDIAVRELAVDLKAEPVSAILGFDLTNLPLLADMLRNGARVEISGDVSLERTRTFWFNEDIVQTPFAFRLRYDSLTRQFLLERDGSPPLQYKSLAPLLEKGFSRLVLPLVPRRALESDNTYVLRATIGVRHLPGALNLANDVFFKSETIVPDVSIAMDFDY